MISSLGKSWKGLGGQGRVVRFLKPQPPKNMADGWRAAAHHSTGLAKTLKVGRLVKALRLFRLTRMVKLLRASTWRGGNRGFLNGDAGVDYTFLSVHDPPVRVFFCSVQRLSCNDSKTR